MHRLGDPALRGIVRLSCPDLVRDVRGRGLLMGVELAEPGLAANLFASLFRRRVLTAFAGCCATSHPP